MGKGQRCAMHLVQASGATDARTLMIDDVMMTHLDMLQFYIVGRPLFWSAKGGCRARAWPPKLLGGRLGTPLYSNRIVTVVCVPLCLLPGVQLLCHMSTATAYRTGPTSGVFSSHTNRARSCGSNAAYTTVAHTDVTGMRHCLPPSAPPPRPPTYHDGSLIDNEQRLSHSAAPKLPRRRES
jgi:hypothetical protein